MVSTGAFQKFRQRANVYATGTYFAQYPRDQRTILLTGTTICCTRVTFTAQNLGLLIGQTDKPQLGGDYERQNI